MRNKKTKIAIPDEYSEFLMIAAPAVCFFLSGAGIATLLGLAVGWRAFVAMVCATIGVFYGIAIIVYRDYKMNDPEK